MKNTSDPASRFAAPFCTALAVVAFACSSKPPATTAAVTPPPTVPGAAGMQAPVVPTMPNVPVAGGPSMGVAGAQAAAAGTGAPSVPMNPGTMPMNPGSMPMNPGGMPTVPVNPGETPQPSASHDWRMMGYDLGSTYFNKAETKLTKQNAAMLASKWTAELSSDINGTPLIVGDKVYAGDGSTTRAYALADGKESWKAMVGSSSSLAYDDGTLYLNENAGKIVAMNAATGTIKWMKPADKQTADGSSSVLIAGELILIGGSNGNNELGGGAFRGYMSALTS